MEEINRPSIQNVTIPASGRDYDVLQAERTLKEFCAFIRTVIAHYEYNKQKQDEAEAQEADLRHCIELVEDLTETEKGRLYEKLSAALKTRRACKYENEVLRPLMDHVADKNLLNRLSQIQGAIGIAKKTISGKTYACRTDVLDDFRMEKEQDGNHEDE